MKYKSFSLPSWLLPLALMLLGSVLRLAYLGIVPGGIHQDESFVAWNAFALKQCHETGISTISVEKGAQWPRLLFYTETLPSQYLATVTYDVAPAPAAFTTADGIRINTRINYDSVSSDSIYIIYYTDEAVFSQDFTLTPFYDWYVAVPK